MEAPEDTVKIRAYLDVGQPADIESEVFDTEMSQEQWDALPGWVRDLIGEYAEAALLKSVHSTWGQV